ncbi:hypothetical protein EXW96_26335 [Paenibacillus sp. JMULE4]|uniref:hypothetical protein n=1 Tax=Paenibacillus sp. JMULE4 TaxID=2518342 RepID=UPI001575F1F0|nr:hypothetical protein [Paenibacillus sp. JMULE4]NTZ20908.1 hypothetical protein [Paenibacillus sp. JMULE4]
MTLTKSQILSKFGPKFAAAGKTAGILQGIHYATGGHAVVTNRHYMLVIHDAHKFEQPLTIHAKTGQPLEGVYPDTSKIIPSSFNGEITILQEEMSKALLAAQLVAGVASKLDKEAPIAQIEILNGHAYLNVIRDMPLIDMSIRISEAAPRENSQRSLNAEYLATALSVFDAAGTGVEIKLRGPLEPIVLTNYNGIDVLILPYRVTQ